MRYAINYVQIQFKIVIFAIFVFMLNVNTLTCTHKGMFRIPVMVYLDPDSILAIAMDEGAENENLPNEFHTEEASQREIMTHSPFVDPKTKAEHFLGAIFNEVNDMLFQINVQLQLMLQHPLNLSILQCDNMSPLTSFMKNIEVKHADRTPYNKMYIIFCDNYAPFLDMKQGQYQSERGKDSCTNHLAFMWVNNDILREKIKTGLLSMISQSLISHQIDRTFFAKICNYCKKCIENRLEPIGQTVDFLKMIVHETANDLMWEHVENEMPENIMSF